MAVEFRLLAVRTSTPCGECGVPRAVREVVYATPAFPRLSLALGWLENDRDVVKIQGWDENLTREAARFRHGYTTMFEMRRDGGEWAGNLFQSQNVPLYDEFADRENA